MFSLLAFLWLIRETKSLLFYIYLWQLKEYHLGRFLAHFQTVKGRKLLWNKIVFFKIVLFFIFLFLGMSSRNLFGTSLWVNPNSPYSQVLTIPLLIFYFFETVSVINSIFQKRLKTPVFTKKATFLITGGFALEFLFLLALFLIIKNIFWFCLGLLTFDIFSPLILSVLVLFFQPATVLIRNQIIKKASQKCQRFKKLLVVGITGSYGKTSTKEFLATILSEKFRVLKTKEHQNSEMGISQCILDELQEMHEIFVCEMGAYNRGGIKLLADIVKPKFGILAGINQQHLATFGSLENIIKTKYELIESLPNNGLAVFNGNNKYCYELYQKTKKPKRISYLGVSLAVREVMEADIWAEDVNLGKEFIYFKTHTKDGDSTQFKVNLLGAENIENILMSALVAKELGMSLEEIAAGCQKIRPWQGAMLLKKIDGLNIIDSTYSANPEGVIAHLDHLKLWKGRRMIVMPCLIELGKAGREIHRKIGKKIGKVCDLAIITSEDYVKEIKQGAAGTKINPDNILLLQDPEEIFEKIKEFSSREDVILLESRVPVGVSDLLFD